MIKTTDKLYDIIVSNIDLLPIVNRFDIKSNIGQKTIATICNEKQIDAGFFVSILNTFHSPDFFPPIEKIDLQSLVFFLTNTHNYLKNVSIPKLYQLIDELKVQNPMDKFIVVVENFFVEYISRLKKHIEYEEKEIFPLVENWSEVKSKKTSKEIKKLFKQHENVENEISDLLAIIVQHIPENANMQLIHDILHALSHFEQEQIDHARFEDKILVPKLLELLK